MPRPLIVNTAFNVAGGAALLACVAWLTARTAGFGNAYVVGSLASYAVAAAVAVATLALHRPRRTLGLANQVTLLRAGLVSLLGGLLCARGALTATLTWSMAAVGVVALSLDAVDGWLARRRRLASPFGARFDLEVDALFILILSLLVWQTGKAGPWVLAIGLMRYGFVAAGWLWPRLSAPLPPRRWRKAVCVLQIVTLLACLPPPIGPPFSTALLAAALGCLGVSFGYDLLRLAPPQRVVAATWRR